MWVSLALSGGERANSSQVNPPIRFADMRLATLSQWCQPLSHHPTHSSCYIVLFPKAASKDICFSRPQETECNDHLPHTSDPLGTFMSRHAALCNTFLWSGQAWSGHTWNTQMFQFLNWNPENQTLRPGTIMPFGDPAQVASWSPLTHMAILTLYSVKCLKQQENQ